MAEQLRITPRLVLDTIWIALGASILFLATATYSRAQVNDVLTTLIPAWSIAQSGTPFLAEPWVPGEHAWLFEINGRLVSNRMGGPVLTGALFYALLGAPSSGDPTWPASVYPGSVAAAVVTALVVAVMFLVFRHVVSRRNAFVATVLFAVATGTWSVSADGLWPHGPAQLGLAVGTLGLVRGWFLASGLGYGYAIMNRPHLAFIPLFTGLWEAWRRRSLRPVIGIGLGSVAGLIGLLAYSKWVFGGWSITRGYAESGFDFGGVGVFRFLTNIAGSLVSPERGLLIYSPLLLLLLPGLPAAWRGAPSWVRSGAIGGVVYLLVQLGLNRFSGGDGFYGYRLPIETLTVAAPLLLSCYVHWTALAIWRRRLFVATTWLSVVSIALGAILFDRAIDQRSYQWNPWTTYRPGLLIADDPVTAGGVLLLVSIALVATWWLIAGKREQRAAEHRCLSEVEPDHR